MPSHLSAGSRICHITTVSWPKGPGGTRRLWFRWLVSLRYFAHAHKSGSAFWHTATCGVGCVRICRVLRLSISLNHIWSEEEIQERLDNLYQHRPKSLTDKIMHRSLSNWHHQELQRWSLCKYKFRLMPFDLLCGHVYVWTKVSDLQHLCVFLCYFIHTWDDQFCWYTHQWAGYSFLSLELLPFSLDHNWPGSCFDPRNHVESLQELQLGDRTIWLSPEFSDIPSAAELTLLWLVLFQMSQWARI